MHGKTYQSKTPKPIKSLKPIKIKQNPFVETTQKQHIPSTILHKNDKTMNNSHNEKKKKNFLKAKFQTFLALLELLISLNALAPLSSASGSNPADVVLGLSFRTLGGAGGSDSAAGGGLDG